MGFLYIVTILLLFIILILNFCSLYSKKNAIRIVNNMGMGYNLGKTFNNFNSSENEYTQNYQIQMWGTILPTKKMISKIKKNGFKTIRFQIVSMNSIDESGKVSFEWISGIREIISYIINSNMYCILSVYYDGKFFQKKYSRKKYINFWLQISKEFANFDEHLIFESINGIDYGFIYEEEYYKNNDSYDYEEYKMNLFNSSQEFIYTIRNSEGYNSDRLLVISELITEIEISFYLFYYEQNLPIDPAKKLAISLNYYFPSELSEYYDISINWYYKYGFMYLTESKTKWGSISDYKEIMKHFEFLKKYYINEGIPVIIGEAGILTEKSKDINSFKEFLYVIFSISAETSGLMTCLWDISEKIQNEMNYYNKEKNIWKDEQIKENFLKISKGKYVNSSEYFTYTNIETESTLVYNALDIDIGLKKVIKIIINARILCELHYNCEIAISSSDKDGYYFDILIEGYGNKQYDGTSIFTIDVSNIDCYNHIEVFVFWGNENDIILNNLTVIYEKNFQYFDYKSYRDSVLEDIN